MNAFSQTTPESLSIATEIYCKNRDYKFEVEGNEYLDNDKVYVCSNNLPIDVTVLHSLTNLPVAGTVVWKKNGVVDTRTGNHTVSVESVDLASGKALLECEFTESTNNTLVSLSLKINSDVSVKFSESARKYQFDANKEQAYINSYGGTEKVGTPWNFIEAGKNDILQAKASKKKGYYAVSNITSSSANLMATPTGLSGPKEDITFDYAGAGQEIIEVYGCQAADPELLIFTADRKELSIEFFQLCDSDDDIQVVAVGDTVSSATDVCIDGGTDLTIDEMYSSSFRKGDDKLYPDIATGKFFVVAGVNKICETKAHSVGPLECPPAFNTNTSLSFANSVLNKVGIYVKQVSVTRLELNYNVYSEDGIFEKKEQGRIHDLKYGHNPTGDTTKIFLVNDLGKGSTGIGNAQGRATNFNFNSLSIDVNDATKSVLVHELGHAKWGLIHPGGPGPGKFGINDLDNFMHGITNQVRSWNIRRYQFNKIH